MLLAPGQALSDDAAGDPIDVCRLDQHEDGAFPSDDLEQLGAANVLRPFDVEQVFYINKRRRKSRRLKAFFDLRASRCEL